MENSSFFARYIAHFKATSNTKLTKEYRHNLAEVYASINRRNTSLVLKRANSNNENLGQVGHQALLLFLN